MLHHVRNVCYSESGRGVDTGCSQGTDHEPAARAYRYAMTGVIVEPKSSGLTGGYKRHPSDALIVVAGLAGAAALSLFRLGNISTAERTFSHGINHLSDGLNGPLEV